MWWWSALDAEGQECVQSAATDAGTYQRQLSADLQQSLRETMEEAGVTVTEVEDRQAFVDATASVYETYARMPDVVAALREAAQ
jgi:TRAP-type transport system periplasmic protein